MSNAVNPVYGNDRFQKIKSSEQLSDLYATDAKVANLSAEKVNVGLLNQKLKGLGSLSQVVGYAPVGFASAAANQSLFLNNVPASAAASSVSSSQLLVLPVGARVVQAVVSNNGTTITGGATFDIGTEAWSATPSGVSNITAGMTVGSINSGAVVGSVSGLTALGSAGDVLTANAAVLSDTGVTVQVLGSANTAGDLAVTLWYLL